MLQRVLLPGVVWTAIDHAHSLNMTPGRDGRPIGLAEVAKRKRRGIKPGIPDYLLWFGASAFVIELKRSADERLSDDQKDILQGLISAEVEVAVCWTVGQVFDRVVLWGLTRPFKIAA